MSFFPFLCNRKDVAQRKRLLVRDEDDADDDVVMTIMYYSERTSENLSQSPI